MVYISMVLSTAEKNETIKNIALQNLFVSPQQVKAFAFTINFWAVNHMVLEDREIWPTSQCEEVGQESNILTRVA